MVLPQAVEGTGSEIDELEALDERELLLEIAKTMIGIAATVADLSVRLAPLEELLEQYRPLLAMAEARMQGGRFGNLRRGAPRAQNPNPSRG